MLQSCCLFLLTTGLSALDLGRFNTFHAVNTSSLQAKTLHDFVREYKRDYVPGTEEWQKREELFRANLDKVVKLQSVPGLSWTPTITKFMDYTEHEYNRLLGYKGRRSRAGRDSGAPAGGPVADLHSVSIPPVFSVLPDHPINGIVRDQGGCGSCWAEAAVSALEGAMAHNKQLMSQVSGVASTFHTSMPTLSAQSMVSCTPNPKHCGGTGGCEGATAELGYALVQQRGLPLAVQWPYHSGQTGADGPCSAMSYGQQGPKIGIAGFTVLPKNKLHPLKKAIVTAGAPIVVSVDATNWNFYGGGVFSDTQLGKGGDFTVNHAVTLVGYAEPSASAMGYWHIKNSWGDNFGERGYIRVEMKANEESHCGWDDDTHVGIACDGDPNRDWVCGTCGMLYDSSFPNEPYLMA